jgi:polysaccharide biosynthesis/export protein
MPNRNPVMRFILVLPTLLLLALFTPPTAQAQDAGYLLNPGDVVRVSVWREEELNREALVQPDGSISFPLVGQVQASGRTAAEVQAEITERIDRYIPDAVVTVELLEARGNIIYVIGEVNKPGQYQLGQPITVVQAISLAGGFTPFAGKGRIRVVRKEGGRERTFNVDYDDVQSGRNLQQNIQLKAGDTVIVPGGSLF